MSEPDIKPEIRLIIILSPLGCNTSNARAALGGNALCTHIDTSHLSRSFLETSFTEALTAGLDRSKQDLVTNASKAMMAGLTGDPYTPRNTIVTVDLRAGESRNIISLIPEIASTYNAAVHLEGMFPGNDLHNHVQNALSTLTRLWTPEMVDDVIADDGIVQRLLNSLQQLPQAFSEACNLLGGGRLHSITLDTPGILFETAGSTQLIKNGMEDLYRGFLGLADIDPINHGLSVGRVSPLPPLDPESALFHEFLVTGGSQPAGPSLRRGASTRVPVLTY